MTQLAIAVAILVIFAAGVATACCIGHARACRRIGSNDGYNIQDLGGYQPRPSKCPPGPPPKQR